MNYWIDLFTGTTWEEFRKAGAHVTGFRERQHERAKRVEEGDVFLCYMKGVSRWVGALEATGTCCWDKTPIWSVDVFPVRFPVKTLYVLNPENGVPIHDLLGELSWDVHKWSGHVRGSPQRIARADGEVILDAIGAAHRDPVVRPVDPKKLKAIPTYAVRARKGKRAKQTLVTVPDHDTNRDAAAAPGDHVRMQRILLRIGARMGLSLWVARNDRARVQQARERFLGRLLERLPTQFDAATTKTIEMIDVLWLSGNSIVAAFEIEHTTSIYSGLLRMSDLLAMQPNLDIRLYLVAPDDRREQVLKEVARPTFAALKKPVYALCRFLPYSQLEDAERKYAEVAHHLRPEFLDDISEDCSPSE